MKFIYFEDQEGGMGIYEIQDIANLTLELSYLYGWMNDSCKVEDEKLLLDAANMQLGDYLDHRLGVLVRVKD